MNINKDLLEDNYNDSFEDIEQMLKPRCEFKVSENLKKEVMERARKETHPHRVVKMWPWLVAACVAGFIIMFLVPPKISLKSTPGKNQIVVKAETRKPAERKQEDETPDRENVSDDEKTKVVEEKVAEESPSHKNVNVDTPERPHTVFASYTPSRAERNTQNLGLKDRETTKKIRQKSKEDMHPPIQPVDEESRENSVQMSEETRMALLLASLNEDVPQMEDMDTDEEIRLIRLRGERLISMYEDNDN